MNSSNRQKLLALLVAGFSLFLLVHAVPTQVATMGPKKSVLFASIQTQNVSEDTRAPSHATKTRSLTLGGIQIKASGEDPGVATPELKEYVAAQEEFERRFGSSFEEAWEPKESTSEGFTVPKELEGTVNFWVHVFGKYEKGEYVFHHRDDVSIVYSVLDLRAALKNYENSPPQTIESVKNAYLRDEKIRVRNMLQSLQTKLAQGLPLNAQETQLAAKFAQNPQVSLKTAAEGETIRIQGGFAHRFREAIVRSGRYIKEMENIFAMKGLPIELTRLPFVESTFNINAYSSADAAGLWQFIPETGKRYLKVDSHADERFDPILATYAAAQHLGSEYKMLKSWPLTINAYNTGPGRMMRAIRQLGTTDIATIIRDFKDPAYQFYSRNYYPEFLAAVHVYENRDRYFGRIETEEPMEYDFFLPQKPVNLKELADAVDMNMDALGELNPALSDEIAAGEKDLPEGYLVRVPKNMGPIFASAANEILEKENFWHIVKQGESWDSIAKTYNLPVTALTEHNPYLPVQSLIPGTPVKLPQNSGVALNPHETTPQM